ncbi:hypothetical protein Salat_2360100 [Sesamum alatum]|uniref:Uncharacterized protein n=1 Tax=Sesamum alatum TaxID=300844 RepID=A0AAE1XXL6_9LAMI|nr:hypothetical protein Salat_2360100 [Sesamum alatum]
MQILQWLLKTTHEPPRLASSSPISKGQVDHKDQKVKSKEIVVLSGCGIRRSRRCKRVERCKLNCENFSLFYLIRRKDVSRACFYHTLNLKRLGSCRRRQHSSVLSMKMKKEDVVARGVAQKADSATHVGNKVLPVTDTAQTSSAKNKDQCHDADKKDKTKGDKTKTISRMKELLKWAAATKGEKGGKFIGRKVLHFRSRSALKAVPDDDQLSNDSPKISFRWEADSCSTTSSVYSALSAVASSLKHDQIVNPESVNSTPLHVRDQCVARMGNWITTDSECKRKALVGLLMHIFEAVLLMFGFGFRQSLCWSCEDQQQGRFFNGSLRVAESASDAPNVSRNCDLMG